MIEENMDQYLLIMLIKQISFPFLIVEKEKSIICTLVYDDRIIVFRASNTDRDNLIDDISEHKQQLYTLQ